MFERNINSLIVSAVKSFPITALLGPRQSGKTTLLRALFPDYKYVSLESPDTLLQVKDDPRSYLTISESPGYILDEAQNFVDLFSYLQEIVDDPNNNKKFILSGSQNFLLSERISQSLAGRVAILELLSLNLTEYLSHPEFSKPKLFDYLFYGSYPRIYQESLNSELWYSSYLKTYVERDIRQIINVQDLSQFQLFIKMCASRHAQELNLQSIGSDCGVSQSTAQRWISALEASYLIFTLKPYYKNFNKRLVKSPKLYFYDSGIVCHLLGIESPEHLSVHSSRGAIFEGYVISDLIKLSKSIIRPPNFYYWRDKSKLEIDLIIEKAESICGIEIKSSATALPDFSSNLKAWGKLTNAETKVVYGGEDNLNISGVPYLGWDKIINLIPARSLSI